MDQSASPPASRSALLRGQRPPGHPLLDNPETRGMPASICGPPRIARPSPRRHGHVRRCSQSPWSRLHQHRDGQAPLPAGFALVSAAPARGAYRAPAARGRWAMTSAEVATLKSSPRRSGVGQPDAAPGPASEISPLDIYGGNSVDRHWHVTGADMPGHGRDPRSGSPRRRRGGLQRGRNTGSDGSSLVGARQPGRLHARGMNGEPGRSIRSGPSALALGQWPRCATPPPNAGTEAHVQRGRGG
jgi:hypothetical protein